MARCWTRDIIKTQLEQYMKTKPSGKLRDGAQCKVIGGVHAGKSGIVTDINTSKTGHVTITVVQPDGERFKTLARNVVI
jgi:ribosomal protein S4E